MEIAKIKVSGVKASLADHGPGRWEIPAGIVGGEIQFAYGPDWEKLTKTVVFTCGNVTKDVVDAGEVVTIPAEVVAKPERKLLVGVYGVEESCETATPTLWLEGYVRSAADPSGDVSTDPALPVWAQLEARIQALEAQNKLCSVMYSLTNVISSNAISVVQKNMPYEASLTAAEGFALVSVSVTMGGTDVTASVYADGKITIGAVTGDVMITAVAEELVTAEFVAVETGEHTGFALSSNGALVSATAKWAYTNFIPTAQGQTFRYQGDTSLVSSYPCVCGYDSAGVLTEILVANGQYPEGEEFTIPAGVRCIRCCFYVGGSEPRGLEILDTDMEKVQTLPFITDTIVNSSGVESAKAGGGVTDFVPITQGQKVTVYNIIPNNGGRIAFYDADKAFVEAVTIFTSGDSKAAVVTTEVTKATMAYVRVSTNVLQNVTATVSGK